MQRDNLKSLALILLFGLLATNVSTASFPSNFSWGASTSAYQIEGAWNVSGKGISWNDWFSVIVNNLPNNETGCIADEFYYRFKKDVALMKTIGLKNFRMSIAWTRVLPNGTIDNPNPDGVAFYNQVFQELVDAGISPWVTLYHADFPQDLSFPNSTGSWLNPDIPSLFNDYAEFCFKNFGDKVKHWITLNEPAIAAWFGYGNGWSPPMRCSPAYSAQCETYGGGGNSSIEPYIAAHNMILAHATAAQTYRAKYKPTQGGMIGWTLNSDFYLPYNVSNPNDTLAVEISLQFGLGWFANPVIFGDYPEIMKEYITGNRLPLFTPEQKELINGTLDFLGLNHYSSAYAQYIGTVGSDYSNDSRCATNQIGIDGKPIGSGLVGQSNWLYSYPQGIRDLLNWTKYAYNDIPVVILENGWDTMNESYFSIPKAIADYQRISVLNAYIDKAVEAVTVDGVNLLGYFVWAWMDNFEWGTYIPRFGLVYVDYVNNLTRIPKASSYWYIEKTTHIQEWALGLREYPYYDDIDFIGKYDDMLQLSVI